ncbi:calcium-binding protein [Ramlibacter sp. PS3R-8]|uniref:calcium-binding protein n=1 Tax=Ramlibacter sp. PS3R-8 TaxID=3133437 RepID=UPI0030ADE5C5
MAALSVTYSFAFEADLNPIGTGNADAASLDGGGVAVVGDDGAHIYEAFFSADGEETGDGSFLGSTGGSASQLSNGNVVIGGSFNGIDGGQASFDIVSATGESVLGVTPIDAMFSSVSGVDVTALAEGGFVLAMQVSVGGNNNVRVNIRDNDGGPVMSFAVDSSVANDQAPSVAALADGGFAIAWHRIDGLASEVWYAVYEANGTERKLPTLLDDVGGNLNPSVVALQDGGFAIAYEDTGWSDTGDTDITLALFDAAGTRGGWTDISQNDFNDTAPSTTLLSNGMIFVGNTNAEFGFDPRWTLVDPANGERLATGDNGYTFVSDTQTSVAGMLDGQVATFFTKGPTTPDIIGQVLQVRRHTSGDTFADDFIVGDGLVDYVTGGGGNDTIRGGGNADYLEGSAGNDTFVFLAGEMAGDTIKGDEDFDRILLAGSANLGAATIESIEEIEFESPSPYAAIATIHAAQVGAGLAANLVIDGTEPFVDPMDPDAVDPGDTLRVTMGDAAAVDLSGFVFFDFHTSGAGLDRVQILGDDDNETITGSAQADTVLAAGGRDVLKGGGGIDTLRGGLGNDTYVVNAAGEAREAAGEGVDMVRSLIAYTLGANIENLQLLGTGDVAGTGNVQRNKLTGNSGANALDGGLENDWLKGGAGSDTLIGGDGRDRFDYDSTADSAPRLSDVISDFAGNGNRAGDLIDLSTIDANALVAGNQVFVFIGSATFTGAGQVRYVNGVLVASTDGDVQAELRIELTGSPPLVAADLVL